MRMFAAALGISALLLAGCGGGEADMEEMDDPEAAEMMEEGEMAPDTMMHDTMMEEGMPEEMEEEGGGMDDEMGGGE